MAEDPAPEARGAEASDAEPGSAEAYEEVIEPWSDDEDSRRDTTALQLAKRRRDIQGIPWELTQYTREAYREVRDAQYHNYFNREEEVMAARPRLAEEATQTREAGPFYRFHRNWRGVRSSILHFQLRNLLAASSAHDLYCVRDNTVNHWSSLTRRSTKVVDVSGSTAAATAPGIGPVQVCTLAVAHGLLAAGGFGGELLVRRLGAHDQPFACSMRVTLSDNGITNAIEICRARSGPLRLLCSNNDEAVRWCEATPAGVRLVREQRLPWAVNCSAVRPRSCDLVCSVGDDPEALVHDASTGRPVLRLGGHLDFSFAVAWHPDGNVLATGNQDMTTRVWDVRSPRAPLALLRARIGAVRALRFSPCGRFLAAAEPADYVTVYDAASG